MWNERDEEYDDSVGTRAAKLSFDSAGGDYLADLESWLHDLAGSDGGR